MGLYEPNISVLCSFSHEQWVYKAYTHAIYRGDLGYVYHRHAIYREEDAHTIQIEIYMWMTDRYTCEWVAFVCVLTQRLAPKLKKPMFFWKQSNNFYIKVYDDINASYPPKGTLQPFTSYQETKVSTLESWTSKFCL